MPFCAVSVWGIVASPSVGHFMVNQDGREPYGEENEVFFGLTNENAVRGGPWKMWSNSLEANLLKHCNFCSMFYRSVTGTE